MEEGEGTVVSVVSGNLPGAPGETCAPAGTLVFETRPAEDLFCPICSEILRQACSPSHCGHWFCEECLKGHLSRSAAISRCPACRTPCDRNRTVMQHIPRRQISELKVHCRYGLEQTPEGEWVPASSIGNEDGSSSASSFCPGMFEIESLSAHEQQCPYARVECSFPGCGERMLRRDLPRHEKESAAEHLALAVEKVDETSRALATTRKDLEATKKDLAATKTCFMGFTQVTQAHIELVDHEVAALRKELALISEERAAGSVAEHGRVISASYDKTLRVWRVADGHCERTITGHFDWVLAVAAFPGGDRVVSGSSDHTLKVFRVADGACETTMKGHGGPVLSVAVLPGAQRVASGSTDGFVKIWTVEGGRCERTVPMIPPPTSTCDISKSSRVTVWSVAVLPGSGGGDDSNTKIVAGLSNNTIQVLDAMNDGLGAEPALKGHEQQVLCVAALPCSPNEQSFVSGSDDGTIRIWRNGQCERSLSGHTSGVAAVAVLPCGDRIVSASGDRTIKVWRVADGRCERTLKGHSREVDTLAVLPRGDRIVSGSRDKTVKVWRLADWRCERTLTGHGREMGCVAFLMP